MKSFFLLLFSFNFIFLTSYSISIWNFDNLAINLLSSSTNYEYIIYKKEDHGIEVILIKQITKIGNIISSKNFLTANSTKKEVSFENIHSYYPNKLGATILICPKGKFHPYDFMNDNYITPPNFDLDDNWDLRCYSHKSGYFFILYAHSGRENFYSVYNNEYSKKEMFKTYLYDYIFEDGYITDNAEYKIATVNSYYNMITLIYNIFILKSDFEGRNTIRRQDLIGEKGHSQATFDGNNYLYFYSYSNVLDFTSGYSTSSLIANEISNTYTLPTNINQISPFSFSENALINEINFIQGTGYVYYSITDKGKNYFGIIDIIQNKILYNINKELSSFIPISYNKIIAFNDNTVYMLCLYKDDNICTNSFAESSDIIIIEDDIKDSTNIVNANDNKIKLMPEDIYIDKDNCDLSKYIINQDRNECGSCGYFYTNKIYKFINSNECIEIIPENAELYEQNLNILKCKRNYYLSNNLCIFAGCYETCETCIELSNDINDQKCLTCKNGFILNNGNCIIITETTILTDEIKKKSGTISNSISHSISNTIDICLEDIKCKTYENNNCNCIQCFDGYYVDNYKCIKCKELCQDYEENTCICNNNTNEYLFYGYYNELKDEKIFLLKTNNLTDVENIILHKVRDKIKNGEINYQLIDNGNYFFVEINNAKFMFANEKDNNKNILANIDLGECKEKINENKNNSLYMFYIQVSEEGMNFPKTEYEIYSKSEDSNIEKIDLEKCKDIKISKEVSINITNENIDKYNSSSAYYNDICYTTTSETGTDITLADRRNEYISNYAICQDNCEFISYDEDNGKAICSCSISTSFSSISDIKFDKDKIKSNFINFKNIANINILKCYKVVFNKQILKNIGCIIVSLILFFEIISVFVFYGYEYNLVKNKIKVIMEAKEWENKQIKLENNNTDKNKRGSKKSLKIINDDKDKGNNISRKSKNEIQIFDKRGSKIKRKSTRKSKFKNIQAPPKSNSNNKINIKNKTSINDKKTSAIFIKNKSINSF